ncbi:hybrid sensor histidine kinase/response regulator [Nannocystis bainbridge]|uniref:histidine kinase n=1 Tax=Nannocystis bainbridge TaxID=2995303 RepID=A0ABT5E935_9BACT|nr:ATP-binding protein [Nannocystis bainbridge]MDC0721276.1 ATP-binding protein [Nannocystis bainbridge]
MSDALAAAQRELEELRLRLAEAQETIRAIQGGEVDALVVSDEESPRVLTLDAADKPYRLLVEQMHHGAAALTIEGVVLACNPAFTRLLRSEPAAVLDLPLQQHIDPPGLPVFEALLRDGLAASAESEVMLRRGDGERMPIVLGVRALHEGVAGVCLLVVDLSEPKRRERLIADEATARAILEQVADAVVVCDNEGTVLRASRAAHDLCGTNPLFQRFDRVFSLTRHDEPGALVDLTAAWRGEPLRGLEVRWDRPGGKRAELMLGAGPLVVAGGERLGVVITLTDITSLREAEDELRRRASELQASDRRKDEFLAMLAHELRNPLSPIQSSLEIMSLQALDDPLTNQCREVIERQVQQLTRLVDDLLEVSRINTGKIQLQIERIDLGATVQRGIETSRPAVDAKQHRLQFVGPPEPVWVRADATRIAQVIGNLVNNAAKYTENGGEIAVRLESERGHAVVRVRDSGIGIPQEMLGEVFDLFTQVHRSLDRSQGGLGIGLALVKRLVTIHGGQVEAHSDGAGLGSEFVIRLPQGESERAAPEPPRADKAGSSGPSLRVLVIDDNRDAAELLAALLGMLGHKVETAGDGPSGIAAALSFLPQLVLCDIGLPLLDGYGVVADLRHRPEFAATRFIALTGYGRAEDRQRSQASGFHAHLIKPVGLAKLKSLLRPPQDET